MATKPASTKIFKIRRMADGLFSTGGTVPYFNAKGKAWTTISGLKNHLNLVYDQRFFGSVHGTTSPYRNCEIITIELTPKVVETTSIEDYLLEKQKKEAEKRQKREEQAKEDQKQRELAELARLQQKYGVPQNP